MGTDYEHGSTFPDAPPAPPHGTVRGEPMGGWIHCGAQLSADGTFCPRCGVRRDTAGSPPARDESPGEPAERRLVTVVFADLVGFTSRSERQDPEDVASFLTDYFARISAVVDRFGGIVEKYIGDAVMAVWGARVANEDDAERAVRAALEMQEVVAELATEHADTDLTLRVGVLTGETAVKPGGNESTGMIVGDLVNTAARLQQTAPPGVVVVGESTYKAASRAVAFAPAATPPLKGKQTSIKTWRALRVVAERRGRGRVEGLDPPFVGRRDELQLLKDLLAGVARDRRSRLVSIAGEVGIGKSRLVWELRKYADGLAGEVYWNEGRSSSFGSEAVAYGAIKDLVMRRLGVPELADAATVAAALDRTLRDLMPDETDRDTTRSWLGALLSLGPTPEGDRAELDAAIRTFLASMAERAPTVLVFEDLQWADHGLLDFVEHLADWIPDRPLLVLAITRPELLERRHGWVAHRRGVVTMRLDPLPDTDLGHLIDGMIGDLAASVRASVIARAGGIPLYAVELARLLMSGADASAAGATEPAVPETLQALVGARLDRLDRADRSLLQDAAVLGHEFSVAGLAAITGSRETDLRPKLQRLAALDFIEPVRSVTSREVADYEFVQELVREVARMRMSRTIRSARHVAAADYVSSLPTPDAPFTAADHYLSALAATPGSPDAAALRDRAATVLFAAVERAASLYAHEEVLSLGGRIADIDRDPGHRLDLSRAARRALLEHMAHAASAQSKRDDAERYALGVVDLSTSVAERRDGAALVAFVNLEAGRAQRALEVLAPFLAPDDDATEAPELARIAGLVARAHFIENDWQQALAAAERALVAAERHGLVAVIGDALITKGTTLGVSGRIVEAGLLLDAIARLARERRMTALSLRAFHNLGALMEAHPHMEFHGDPMVEAIDLARRTGNVEWGVSVLGSRAVDLMERAEWDQAAEALADPLWSPTSGALRAFLHALQALYAALRGRRTEAEAALEAALPDAEPGLLETVAMVRLLTGDTHRALAWAEETLADDSTTMWAYVLARILLLAGDETGLRAVLERGLGLDERMREFIVSLEAVEEGDSASIARAEAAITSMIDAGIATDEVFATIALGRALPEGSATRVGLMARAAERIDHFGLAGFAGFVDPVALKDEVRDL